MTSILDLSFQRNSISYHSWSLGDHCVPLVVLSGKLPGPKLMLSGMLHHDELSGPGAFHSFIQGGVSLEELHGDIFIFPLFSALQTALWRQLSYPHQGIAPDVLEKLALGKESWNPNRFFPGKANGDWMENFSYLWMENVVQHMDALLDFHCCRMTDGSFCACLGSHQKSIDLGKALQLDFIDLQSLETKYVNTMFVQAAKKDIMALLVEIPGVHEMIYPDSQNQAFDVIQRALFHLGMLDKESETPEKPMTLFHRSEGTDLIHNQEQGIFIPNVRQGQFCRKEQLLGVLRSLENFQVIEEFFAPYDGACASIGADSFHSVVGKNTAIICYKKAKQF